MADPNNRWRNREGGCLCGAVRYRIEGTPLLLLACHCTDCQVRSGGSFSLSMPVAEADLRTLRGEPSMLESRHEEHIKHSAICPNCHVRLWLTNTAMPGVVVLKGGTLDDRSDLEPVAHIWVRSKQPWFQLPPDVLQFQTQPQPTEYGPVIEAWGRQQAQAG